MASLYGKMLTVRFEPIDGYDGTQDPDLGPLQITPQPDLVPVVMCGNMIRFAKRLHVMSGHRSEHPPSSPGAVRVVGIARWR